MSATTVTECPHGALIVRCPAGTFTVAEVGVLGWYVHAWAPGDTESAGHHLGHWPSRAAAVAALEVELGEILSTTGCNPVQRVIE